MPIFLFYPHLPDGSASTFVAEAFPNAIAALAHAQKILAEHGSAAEVIVWRDNVMVGRARIGRIPELVAATNGLQHTRPEAWAGSSAMKAAARR